jgi:hypothetical protein
MVTQALFGLSILMSFAAFGLVTRLYVWPQIQRLERDDAILALTVPHAFRFIGLAFLVPGVVAETLPAAFAVPTATGDLITALLAIVSSIALSRRASLAIALVWLFNLWGTADLLLAYYHGVFGAPLVPGMFGAAYYIPAAIVPALFIGHGIIFKLLLSPRQISAQSNPLRNTSSSTA